MIKIINKSEQTQYKKAENFDNISDILGQKKLKI